MTDAELLDELDAILLRSDSRSIESALTTLRNKVSERVRHARDTAQPTVRPATLEAISATALPLVKAAVRKKAPVRSGLVAILLPLLLPIIVQVLAWLFSNRPAMAAGMLNPDEIDADIVNAAMASEVTA